MSGAGAFLSGLAGGFQSGRDMTERRAERELRAEELRQARERANQAPPVSRGVIDQNDAMAKHGGPTRAAAAAMTGDRELLAKTLMAEAGGEGEHGMLAAGAVIVNRARLGGRYGDGIDGVIMRPGQFSAWNKVTGYAGGEGGLDMDRIKPSAAAYRVADMLLSGSYDDPTGGATHYYNPAVANPKWGQRAGGKWQRIGNHIFGFADGRPGSGYVPDRPAARPAARSSAESPDPKPDSRPAANPLPSLATTGGRIAGQERGIDPTTMLLRKFYPQGGAI